MVRSHRSVEAGRAVLLALAAGAVMLIGSAAPAQPTTQPATDQALVAAVKAVDGHLEALLAVRDKLASELAGRIDADARAGPQADLTLNLEGGADGDDVVLCLAQRGGKWVRHEAVVPAWRQETFQEQWAGTFYMAATAVPFDRLRYPVTPGELALEDGTLKGRLAADLRLDATKEQRFEPGKNWTGLDKVSWYDRFGYVGHTLPRQQSYTLSARAVPGAVACSLVLEKAVEGRGGILIDFVHPAGEWSAIRVATPTYNAGHHRGRVLEWKETAGVVQGKIEVALLPDNWFPKDQTPRVQTFEVTARVLGGRLTGSYKSSGALGSLEAAVSGRMGTLVEGWFSSQGELGAAQGRVRGMVSAQPDQVREWVPAGRKAASGGNGPREALVSAAAEVAGVYQQVRALRLALLDYPRSLAEALVATDLARVSWAGDALTQAQVEAMLAFAADAVRVAQATPGAARAAGAGRPSAVLPFGQPKALAADAAGAYAVTADLPAGWYSLPRWWLLGPLTQTSGDLGESSGLPDLIPCLGASYDPEFSKWTGRGISPPPLDKGKTAQPLRWQPTECLGTRLGNDARPVISNRFKGGLWYALAELDCDAPRQVHLALSATDRAAVWVNDQLVWSDVEKPWSDRLRGGNVVAVDLKKGHNRILARIRYDRSEVWLRCQIGLGDLPAVPAPGAALASKVTGYRGDGSGHYPAADPPLAWDLAKGLNVLWRTPLAGARGLPIVVGDNLLTNLEPDTLLCLDKNTGKERWRAKTLASEVGGSDVAGGGMAHATPVSDGTHVFVHYATGVTACYSLDGQRRWAVRNKVGQAALRLAAGSVITEGTELGAKRGKGAPDTHRILALDARSGAVRWEREVEGGMESEATVAVALPLAGGGNGAEAGSVLEVVIAADGQVLAADDGRVLRSSLEVDRPGDYRVSRQGGRVYFTAQGRRVGAELLAVDRDRVATRWLWEANYEVGGFGSPGQPSVAADGLVYTWGMIQERGPHCPVPLVEVCILDGATGRMVNRIKPVFLKDAQAHDIPPAIAGEYLFVVDAGGGSHSSSQTFGQIGVIRTGAQAYVAARNLVELGSTSPVPDGNRLYVRSAQSIVCLAVTTPDGRKYQEERLAQQTLADVGVPPTVGRMRTLAPLTEPVDPAATPVEPLADDLAVGRWLIAGPLARDARPAGDPAGLRPTLGASLSLAAGGTAPFQPFNAHPTDVVWPHDGVIYYLQGRGVAFPAYRLSVPPDRLTGPANDQAAWLYTVLNNTRQRTVQLATDGQGLAVWMSGQPVTPGEPLLLKPGLYPLLARVEPRFFRKVVQPPVDVAKALAGGSLKLIGWPGEWTALDPLPEAFVPLPGAQLKTVPESLTVNDTVFATRKLTANAGMVDLTALVAPADGGSVLARDFQGRAACLFTRIEAPADGRLVINATADWYMAWYLDGELIHSTLEKGNRAIHTVLTAHTIGADLTRGKHTLAVLVKPGTKGWSFGSIAGFTDKPDVLAPYVIAPKTPVRPPDKTPAKTPEQIDQEKHMALYHKAQSPDGLALRFRQTDDPDDLLRAWTNRAAARKDLLERIVKELPGTPLAATAQQYLSDLAARR